jgi:hypothetical protein
MSNTHREIVFPRFADGDSPRPTVARKVRALGIRHPAKRPHLQSRTNNAIYQAQRAQGNCI